MESDAVTAYLPFLGEQQQKVTLHLFSSYQRSLLRPVQQRRVKCFTVNDPGEQREDDTAGSFPPLHAVNCFLVGDDAQTPLKDRPLTEGVLAHVQILFNFIKASFSHTV